ncbi:MAG: phospho-N-acetylmuramoyl-pentapeptide-transferase [Propionibacteriaceae bacterium]|nr:phospho-N-acetylmuramoyl-pentapeptide-transferase [Propionibacteriaceae bacterium]
MKTILFAAAAAMVLTLLGTRVAIGILVKQGYGQFIRDDGPTAHHTKRGTPTMGGIVIMISVVLAYFLAHLITWRPPTASSVLALYLFLGAGFIGFLDDWTKISKQRSLGLDSKGKMLGLTIVAVTFGILAFQFPNHRDLTPASSAISFLRDIPLLTLPIPLAIVWIVLLVAGTTNAVNLTDGLDGLATGAATMVFGAYVLINIWQYNQSCASLSSQGPRCYEVRDPHDLAVVAAAMAAACFAFLWWNTKPAKIFMGDSGSLSLGGGLAALAIFTRTELLLAILGGLFVIITMSVILQVGYFKATKGKRLFKMAPLQHHFELMGWGESTIVVRFWIVCGICVSLGLGIFYAEWVAGL